MSLRLFWQVASLEARTRMTYRADFWLGALVGFLADFGVVFFLWTAMFRESGRTYIGGRDLDATVVYYLAVVLLGKIVRGDRFHGTGVSQDIYEGQLNRYLVFPASYAVFKYAQRLGLTAPIVLQMVFLGVVALVFLDARPHFSAPGVAMALAAIALAHLLYYLCTLVIHQFAFWADNVWSLEVAFWLMASVCGGWMLPLSVFPDGARALLEVLPFRFFYDLPARTLLGEIGPAAWTRWMALGVCWCAALGALARIVWARGQLRYTGVGI